MGMISQDPILSSEHDLPTAKSSAKDRLLLEKLKINHEKIELDVVKRILQTPKGDRTPED